MARKIRVGVVFGGRSGEHEVSLVSARSVMEAIDKTKKVEEALKKPPLPPYQEFFYVPWE